MSLKELKDIIRLCSVDAGGFILQPHHIYAADLYSYLIPESFSPDHTAQGDKCTLKDIRNLDCRDAS